MTDRLLRACIDEIVDFTVKCVVAYYCGRGAGAKQDRARLRIEKMLGTKLFLELYVKVQPGWRDARGFVEELDWRRQLEHAMGMPVMNMPVMDRTVGGRAASDARKKRPGKHS